MGQKLTSGTGIHHLVAERTNPSAGVSNLSTVLAGPVPDLPLVARAEAVSEVIFTSGTESRPKAVMHTEQTTNAGVRLAQRTLDLGPDEVVWMPSPIGHSTGLNYGVRLALFLGLPLVLQDRWDPEHALDLVLEHGCTYTLAATTFLAELVKAAESRGVQPASLRYFGCGGAPVPAELVRRAAKSGIGVLRLYGSTEALVVSWNRPWSPTTKREETDGLVLDDMEVAVQADDGSPVAPGDAGELYVRGPSGSVGFFRDSERTSATFTADGWIRSGDIGVLDADGYVTIVGRKKEIIIRGGMNIAPREIEDLIAKMPGVAAVAAIGVPDQRLGEIVCACVVAEEGSTLRFDDMISFLRDRELATYKLPQRLVLLDSLPRTASGKVQKPALLEAVLATPEA